MKKQLIIVALVLVLIITPTLSHADTEKLLWGLGFIGIGSYFAIFGFNVVEKTDEWNTLIPYKQWVEGEERFVTYKVVHYIKHKEEAKDIVLGCIGVGCVAAGTYLVIDYFIDLNKVKNKTGIEVGLAKKRDVAYLLCSKRF